MGSKIGLILFIIVLAGLGLYLITSGVITKGITALGSFAHVSSTTSFFHFNFSSGAPAYTFLQPIGNGATQTVITSPSSGGSSASTPPAIDPSQIPTGYTLQELSPYFHEVRIQSAVAGNYYSYGTITLDAELNNPSSSIDITGWEIKSRDSGEYIPQAVLLYDYSGSEPENDIRVKNGDVVSLYSSSAPFNLRLNECIGYVAHVANFVPALPLYCPYIDQSQIQNLSGACQNYIESINSCQAPNTSNPEVSQNDYACQNFLNNNFTYKSCLANHESDANFLSNQVWIWTGSNIIDQYHDTISLLDQNGLLVDQYAY